MAHGKSGQRGDQYVSSELFILAAMDIKGALADILKQAGANRDAIEKAIDEMRGGEQVVDPNAEENRQALEKYTIDLTERAEQSKLDPVIGRDEEIRRCVQVLQRRTKNNPVSAHRTASPEHRWSARRPCPEYAGQTA